MKTLLLLLLLLLLALQPFVGLGLLSEDVWGSGCINPCVLDLETGWR
jgi:hypothetical protein